MKTVIGDCEETADATVVSKYISTKELKQIRMILLWDIEQQRMNVKLAELSPSPFGHGELLAGVRRSHLLEKKALLKSFDRLLAVSKYGPKDDPA